jgi:hypothetical protein
MQKSRFAKASAIVSRAGDGDDRALLVNLVDQGACGCLGEYSGDSAHAQREPDALLVPRIASQVNCQEWPDPGLHIREKEIQPVKRPK